ncbi:MAG: hypothetical protein A2542_02430 [Parcubacteria group bacterium RIFOXYD2_FULL_52_8]|nr:MAG: hypothetical protein A2542_02430 [Parcubacteria group bacterium RIFOXYD2_FULL_52_8]
MTPKPILFIDFDRTLCHDRFWRSVAPEQYAKHQAYLFGADKQLVRDWMLGKYTSEEINELVAKETGAPYDILWQTFVRDCETMHIEPAVLAMIDALRKRYTVVLATDNMDCLDRFTVPALGLANYFDRMVNSFAEKRFKSSDNGKLFADVAADYGVALADCTLFDDSKTTCATFAGLGGKVCLVTLEQPLTYWLQTIDADATVEACS